MNLVTGATGLLGSHICEQLKLRGMPVRALVRKGSDTQFLESLGVEFAYGDVTDAQSLMEACKGIDIVYHAAARVGDWGPWPEFVAITIEGTANMIAAATKNKVKRFLQISSISTYGHVDGAGLILDEEAPLGQNLYRWAYYSRSKVEAEKLVWAAHKKGDIQATVCKPSWLYGPRDRASMPRMIRALQAGKAKIVGNGENRLNLTYAGNEAEGCILAANSPKAVGEIYNLASDGVITLSEYWTKIAAALGVKPNIKKVPYKLAQNAAFMMEVFGHLVGMKKPPLITRYSLWLMSRKCFFSSEKARTELNWQPTVGYDEGIARSVAWCKEHGAV